MTAFTLSMPAVALAGLAAITVPIVIHLLLKPPVRRVPWAAMEFILEAARRSLRGLRIRRWLLLLLRCLIPALLGLALAGPATGSLSMLAARHHLQLVIDDGAVSAIPGPDGEAGIDVIHAMTMQLLEQLQPGDSVGIIRTDPAKDLAPTVDIDRAKQSLRDLTAAHAASDIPGQLRRAASALSGIDLDDVTLHVVSEFRDGTGSFELPGDLQLPGHVRKWYSVPATKHRSFTRIRSASLMRSTRFPGDSAAGAPRLRLVLDRQGTDLPGTLDMVLVRASGTTRELPVTWVPGQREIVIEHPVEILLDRGVWSVVDIWLRDTDVTAAHRFVVLEHPSELRVLVLGDSPGLDGELDDMDPASWVMRVLGAGEVSSRRIDARHLQAMDLVDMDAVIVTQPDRLDHAGWRLLATNDDISMLLAMPGGDDGTNQWVESFGSAFDVDLGVGPVALRLPDESKTVEAGPDPGLLRLLDSELPTLASRVHVRRIVPLGVPEDWVVPLLAGPDTPVYMHGISSRGTMLAILATSMRSDWTDLSTRPLVIPLVHESIRAGVSDARSRRHGTVGDAHGHASARPIGVDDAPTSSAVFDRPGAWAVLDATGAAAAVIEVNVDEGSIDLSPVEASVIAGRFNDGWHAWDPTAQTTSVDGRSITRLIVWVLVGILLLELLVARSLSHRSDETVRRPGLVT